MPTKDRVNREITRSQVDSLIVAAYYAFCIQCPLNLYVTIHLAQSRSGLRDNEFTHRLLKCARDWLEYRDCPACYTWVREAERGSHVNLLIHVPILFQHDFKLALWRWIKRLGGTVNRKVLCIRPMRFSGPKDDWYDYLHLGIGGLLAYVLKGAAPDVCSELQFKHVPQGPLIGKRCGYSEALGAKRRRWRVFQYRWQPRLLLASTETRLLRIVHHAADDLPITARALALLNQVPEVLTADSDQTTGNGQLTQVTEVNPVPQAQRATRAFVPPVLGRG